MGLMFVSPYSSEMADGTEKGGRHLLVSLSVCKDLISKPFIGVA